MSIEAMKMALDALECINEGANKQGPHTGISWRDVSAKTEPAIFALRAAIAEAAMQRLTDVQQEMEQGPVAWRVHPFNYGIGDEGVFAVTQLAQQRDAWIRKGWNVTPLYTRPPRREWIGLTDAEIKELIGPWGDTPIKGYTRKLFDQIEAKLKEKNS